MGLGVNYTPKSDYHFIRVCRIVDEVKKKKKREFEFVSLSEILDNAMMYSIYEVQVTHKNIKTVDLRAFLSLTYFKDTCICTCLIYRLACRYFSSWKTTCA